jgi:hypothetical protein
LPLTGNAAVKLKEAEEQARLLPEYQIIMEEVKNKLPNMQMNGFQQ